MDVRLSAQIMERVLDLRMEGRPVSVGSFAANLRSFESIRDFIASATITTLVDLPFILLFCWRWSGSRRGWCCRRWSPSC